MNSKVPTETAHKMPGKQIGDLVPNSNTEKIVSAMMMAFC